MVTIALAVFLFNTLVHCGIAFVLLRGSRRRAVSLWETMLPDVPFERPGSGLKYAVVVAGSEAWALGLWAFSSDRARDLRMLFEFEIFAVCGCNAYDTVALFHTQPWGLHLQNIVLFGGLNYAAYHYYRQSSDDHPQSLFSKLHPTCIFMYCTGYLFNWMVVYLMRSLRIAKFEVVQTDAGSEELDASANTGAIASIDAGKKRD